eukprot:scaffold37581_cov26-Prasinocladus_malaysianus.AAC.1
MTGFGMTWHRLRTKGSRFQLESSWTRVKANGTMPSQQTDTYNGHGISMVWSGEYMLQDSRPIGQGYLCRLLLWATWFAI